MAPRKTNRFPFPFLPSLLEFFRASLGSRAFQAKPEPEARAMRVQAFQAFQVQESPKSARAFQAFTAWGGFFTLPEKVSLLKLKIIIYYQRGIYDFRYA